MNKNMKKIIAIFSTVLLLGAVTGCDNYLDVNTDPNSVASVENGLILPAVEANIMFTYGLYGHVIGSYFSEQWAQKCGGPQYINIARFNTSNGTQGASYANYMYNYIHRIVHNNAGTIMEQATASENWGDYLAATVYRVFGYQMLIDVLGETPYSEAQNTAITAPKYDEGKDVYAGIIGELDAALAQVTGNELVCNNMLFLGDNSVENYIQFANALKLRLLMRQSGAVDSKAALASLIAEDNFPTEDIAFASSLFSNEAGKDSPLYGEIVRALGDARANRHKEAVAHMALTSTMNAVNDPRIEVKFDASVENDDYEGGYLSGQQSVEKSAGYVNEDSYCEAKVRYNDPVYLITVAETEFFLAEYYTTIAPDAAKAEAHYKAAIDASFDTHGVEGSEAIYAPGAKYAWDSAKAIELIAIQKWVALAGINGLESWCEVRRLGYPTFNAKTGDEIYDTWCQLSEDSGRAATAGQLIAEGVYEAGKLIFPDGAHSAITKNTVPARMLYTTTSTTANSNVPDLKSPNDKIFWAK